MVWISRTIKIVMVVLLISLVVTYFLIRGSLPTLEGQLETSTPSPTTIARDHNGIATIYAQNRDAIAFSLGFLHSQERFFQMDLLRRNSAGELSEIFGPLAINHDKKVRLHQFRQQAHRYIENLPAEHRSILDNYTRGVNEGLQKLSVKPIEYLLLGVSPNQWLAEDSMLVLYSMYMDLQYEFGQRERLLGLLQNNLMPDVYSFLTPKGSRWDAAIDNTQFKSSPIPKSKFEVAPLLKNLYISHFNDDTPLFLDNHHEALAGSNSWVVSGSRTDTGAAMLANDMHLGIRLPNIWYRAGFRYQAELPNSNSLESKSASIKVDGVTLPGTPAMVVGSNRNIAWGFTNSYGDWSDVINLELNDSAMFYQTPDGMKKFDVDTEVIRVKNQKPVTVDIQKTIWGPVIGKNTHGQLQALRWVAHDEQGINFNLLQLEQATTVAAAVKVAHTMGIPAQNIVIAGTKGDIAWTIAGPMPKRISTATTANWQTPQDWSKGEYTWQGYYPSTSVPVVYQPKEGRIWTGNSRVIGTDDYVKIGNGGYALGARSQQIRDLLRNQERYTEATMLAIANNHEARFLERWRELLVNEVLTTRFVEDNNLQHAVTHLKNWQALASTSSVGYTIVKSFRDKVRHDLFTRLFTPLANLQNGKVNFHPIRHQIEVPMWKMVSQQPQHLLPEGFETWNEYLQNQMFKTVLALKEKHSGLDNARWGAANATQIHHPLSRAIPALGWLFDMPKDEVTGDAYMPNVQGPDFGASERFVVSPGFENNAILHMPSGQSGHPLSPYYGKGHKHWVEGKPMPLLPSEPKYVLELY
jgi:penicillin G amidase